MRVYRHPGRPREVLAFAPEVRRADEEAAGAAVALNRVAWLVASCTNS